MYGGEDQHGGGVGHQPHDGPDMEAAPIEYTETWPVRRKTPNIRYPATEFDLSSARTKGRDTMYNPRDSKNNYEEVIQEVSNVEDAPELTNGDNGNSLI